MPKKRRSRVRVGISKESVRKIGTIAQKTEEETFEALIHDFDVQGSTETACTDSTNIDRAFWLAEKLKKQYMRLYRSDVRKVLQLLPQKSSIPKVGIYIVS